MRQAHAKADAWIAVRRRLDEKNFIQQSPMLTVPVMAVIDQGAQDAEQQKSAADQNSQVVFWIRVVLSAVMLAFCIWLLVKHYEDTVTKLFGFTSLGAIMMLWFPDFGSLLHIFSA